MRWVPFVILVILITALQTSLVGVLAVTRWTIRPDLLAMVAVFVALNVRGAADAMIAGWIMGMAVDLTAAGGGATAVGPMSLAYALGIRAIYQVREALFGERAVSQAVLTFLFGLSVYWLWLTLQVLRVGHVRASVYGVMLLQAVGVALYTAILAPLAQMGLRRIRGWIISAPPGRSRR